MDLHKVLLDMEDPMNRLRDGICALWVMSSAVDQEDGELAKGMHALWDYMDQMYDKLHTQFCAGVELCQAEHKGSAPAQD